MFIVKDNLLEIYPYLSVRNTNKTINTGSNARIFAYVKLYAVKNYSISKSE